MSLLDIIPGGSYLQTALDTASKKVGYEKAIITGHIGKAYYGAQAKLANVVSSSAEVAQTVTTGVRNYAVIALVLVGFVIAWPLIAPMLANALERRTA